MTTVSSTIRVILKWIGIAAGSLVLLVLVLFAAAWAINLHDEPLTPVAQALLVARSNPCKPEDNIYLALAGSWAPPGESPVAAGQARIERYNQTFDRAQRVSPLESIEMIKDVTLVGDPRDLHFRGELEFKGPIGSYWNEIPAHRANVEKLKADNAELYERYRALHRMSGYFETARPSVMAPLVFADRDARMLFLADAVLKMRNGGPNQQREGLADLGEDLRLWRTVLTGDGALVSKMVAIAYLHWDELLLADVIADPHAPVPVGANDVDAVVPAFALEDWNIGSVFRTEFLVQVSLLEQERHVSESGWTPPGETAAGRWVSRIANSVQFFKFNATENLYAEQAARFMRSAAPGAGWEAPVSLFGTWRALYNPAGKYLVAFNEAAFRDYVPRAWDGAAFHRLLRVSYEIRRQRIGAGGIPAFLQQHPEWSVHPADGRPFQWDPKAGTLRAQPVQAHPRDRPFLVRVWRPPTGG